jgi:hypothetical protein
MGRFRQDLESYLSADLLDAAIEPGRHSLPRIADVSYFGFCDPSGGRRDSMTLAIAHVDQSTKKVILDRIEERRAPFKPQEVVQDFSRILRLYGLTHLSGDRYSGVWVSSEFANCGVMYEPSEISTSEFYLSFLPLISNGNVELLDDKRLIAQLKGLERRTRVGSRDLITHYPGGFDDLAASCAGVCVNAFNQSHDIEFNHLVEELTRRHYEAEMESELTDEEKLDRRMMKWLVGGELEPPDDLKSLPDEFESICNTRGKTSLELDDGVQKTRRGKKDEAFIEVLRYGGKDERQKI